MSSPSARPLTQASKRRHHHGEKLLDLPILAEDRSSLKKGPALNSIPWPTLSVKKVVPQLGIVGLDITREVVKLLPSLRRPSGVVVAARREQPSFSGAVLQTGDAIYSVNRKIVENVRQLQDAMNTLKSGQAAVLSVERSGKLLYIPLELE